MFAWLHVKFKASLSSSHNFDVAREISKISLHSLRRNFAPEENKFEMKEGVTGMFNPIL